MTAISHGPIGSARDDDHPARSPVDTAGMGSRRFWLWASALWLFSVAVTAAVAAGDAVAVAIGGMTLAAVCGVLMPAEPAATVVPERTQVAAEADADA